MHDNSPIYYIVILIDTNKERELDIGQVTQCIFRRGLTISEEEHFYIYILKVKKGHNSGVEDLRIICFLDEID